MCPTHSVVISMDSLLPFTNRPRINFKHLSHSLIHSLFRSGRLMTRNSSFSNRLQRKLDTVVCRHTPRRLRFLFLLHWKTKFQSRMVINGTKQRKINEKIIDFYKGVGSESWARYSPQMRSLWCTKFRLESSTERAIQVCLLWILDHLCHHRDNYTLWPYVDRPSTIWCIFHMT